MNRQEMAEKFASDPSFLARMTSEGADKIKRHMELTRRISQGQTPSRAWEKMTFHINGPEGATVWKNKLYQATLRRHENGWALGGGPWAQIGIWTVDGNARHDWREFQRIKNDLLGAEWEAVELYPAESRLLDPSNYYILWAAPAIKVGQYEGRTILGPDNCAAPQRGWSKGDEPVELKRKV